MEYTDLTDAVADLLAGSLPTSKSALKTRLTASMKLQAPLLQAKVNAHKLLLEKRGQFLHPKDKELTDVDRKIRLDEATAEYQAGFELLDGLAELLSESVAVIKSLLSTAI